MLLENKNAVIYGGGGEIGGVVARAFVGRGGQCGGPYGFRPRRLDDRGTVANTSCGQIVD
jgi:NAD(P)-dependent dehydrogenase (short-subunit alcohol dehydrogenase family)